MARYTGPAYRKARRVGFSLLESGKISLDVHMGQVNMVLIEKVNLQTMVHN